MTVKVLLLFVLALARPNVAQPQQGGFNNNPQVAVPGFQQSPFNQQPGFQNGFNGQQPPVFNNNNPGQGGFGFGQFEGQPGGGVLETSQGPRGSGSYQGPNGGFSYSYDSKTYSSSATLPMKSCQWVTFLIFVGVLLRRVFY